MPRIQLAAITSLAGRCVQALLALVSDARIAHNAEGERPRSCSGSAVVVAVLLLSVVVIGSCTAERRLVTVVSSAAGAASCILNQLA